MDSIAEKVVPKAFVWRRLHSLMGFWLVLFLVMHLTTNSQAALWIGNDGAEFVKLVNVLESLPYLEVVEIVLLGIPILIHGILGIKYAISGRHNSAGGGGKKPSLHYGRNRAYSWQRYSSWILLIGIVVHIVQMRFIDYPQEAVYENTDQYLVKLQFDPGLYTLTQRLGVQMISYEDVEDLREKDAEEVASYSHESSEFSYIEQRRAQDYQEELEQQKWTKALKGFSLSPNEVIVAASSPGKAMLLSVRNTFKSYFWCAFYTVFVIATCFHAFNGFWTFLITWGALLSMRSQRSMVPVCISISLIIGFLGLAAIWGSYWINLRY